MNNTHDLTVFLLVFQYNQIMCIVRTSFSIQSNHVYCSSQVFNTIKSCVFFVLVFSIKSNHHHSYQYFSTIKSCVLFITSFFNTIKSCVLFLLVFQYSQIMCIVHTSVSIQSNHAYCSYQLFKHNQIMCIVHTSFSIQSIHVYCSYQFYNTIK